MKHIKLLPDIPITALNGEQLRDENGTPAFLPHRDFILSLLGDKQWIDGGLDWLYAAFEIKRLVLGLADDATSLPLEDAHYEKLKKVAEEPTQRHPNPNVTLCSVPLVRSIADAKDDR